MSWMKRLYAPLAYVILTLVMTYPSVFQLGSRVMGNGEDVWIFWWNNWWVKKILTTSGNVYFTPYLFFPQGVDLTYHSFSWPNTALWLILEPLVGDIAAYNLTILWVFPLAGWGMERLVYDLTDCQEAAFLAGLVYAFVPYRIDQYNHPNLMGTHWMPFYTLYLLRAMRSGHWRHIALAGLFAILTALTGWNLLVYLALWTIWLAIYQLLSRKVKIQRLFVVLVSASLIGVFVLSPLLVPMLTGRFGEKDTLGNVEQKKTRYGTMQTDLMAYILPNKFHPLWRQAVEPAYDRIGGPNGPRRAVCLGYVVMALLGYGLSRSDVRRRGLWWGGIALWWLMSLGPFLKFNGKIYSNVPLPYYPLSRLYVFRLLRIPDRYNLVLSLPAAAVVGYAARDLLGRLEGKVRFAAFIGLSALVLFEYLPAPVDMQTLQIPPFYDQLAQEDGRFAIVELPIDFHRTAKQYMLYQTVHERPIVEGHVSRRPTESTDFLDAHPLLRSLHQTREMDLDLIDISRQLRSLREVGFRYIVIHKHFVGIGRATRWRDYLSIAPRHEDDDVVVFTTDPQPGVDFELMRFPGYELGIIRSSLGPETLPAGETLSVDVRWASAGRQDRDFHARFRLVDTRGKTRQQWTRPLTEGWPTSAWECGDVALALYALRLEDSVQTGTYSLTLALEEVTSGTVSPPLDIGTVQVHVEGAGEGVRYDDDYRLGEHIRLRQVRLSTDTVIPGDVLTIMPVWESDGRVAKSYKIFCHILSQNGELIAQRDGTPLNGVRPTSTWRAGEVIEDSYQIPLGDDVAPGEYELSLGMYDPKSLERLPAYDAEGKGLKNDRIVLGSLHVELPEAKEQ